MGTGQNLSGVWGRRAAPACAPVLLALAALPGFTGFTPAALAQTSTAPAQVETPVLARAIAKGDVLSEADFVQSPLLPAAARGALLPQEAAGKEAVRLLREGSPVRASDLAAPRLVRRGQAVTITYEAGPLVIQTGGRALGDAGAGEPVRVLNLSSNRTLDGIADSAGRVRVTNP